MKERLTGIGLAVGTVLTLGVIIWADSAQAFSLHSPVTVTNVLIDPATGDETDFGDPIDVRVGSGVELTRFGGVWDIDLGDNSIAFDLNSIFGNVISGNDVYRFSAPKFGKPGQSIVTDFTVTALGSFAFRIFPIVKLMNGNEIEVIFPLEFAFPILDPNEPRDPNAPNLTTVDLGLRIDLTTESTPVPIPTPTLLPGLVGMGLAAWRNRRGDA